MNDNKLLSDLYEMHEIKGLKKLVTLLTSIL
jgi:hypothetical protein